ncbi:PTS transporter subunit EIIC [Enterococcus hulanensis]|uniref:Permease IIC component n=1 Tax=Enterococcus hulanensis TaxID=2559929 RepID=A0ABU3F1U2_9ENTE|nr:PTS transporter subunit EIIC [Enterococcus hulanensis]MDT2601105.1 PTS transporter subunit EIIC [Enterococcus hulanensis]MDT2610413.1 PTS transporter subunit EIIC [Enterococcus hulanensis]MDT2617140.1 PTS transporter subunit EIIC [Enterococcus hulanensis]MDT2628340.1 PTS transporter subunit EIIC [Enterococcus hulanensis]MDT2655445.1 PTS transporter subunit EIIC [Enterococcus hulanensis]
MKKLTALLEKYLLPFANIFSKNRYLVAIKDAFLISLPFTIFSSMFTAIANIPFLPNIFGEKAITQFQAFVSPTFSLTMGVISFIVAAGIGYSLSNHYNVNPIYGAIVSLISFIMITPMTTATEAGEQVLNVLPLSEVGAVGMFAAIIMSIIATEIYRYAIQHNWTIKMPSSVPKLVSDSFFSFIPIAVALIAAFAIRMIFEATPFETVNNLIYQVLQKPLTSLGTSLPATIIVGILVNLFWFFGLHGHVIVGSVMVPIWNAQSFDNLAAFQAGKELPHLVTGQFTDFFVLNGGYLSIPVLISLLFLFKKRTDWNDLGKIALAPGIFGVYEPLIFGLPIMLNPIMFIPLVATPIITTTLSYLAMNLGLVPFTTGVALPYTMPLIVSGAIVTNSIRGAILQIVLLIILTFMWYVFLKVLDNQNKMEMEQTVHD